MLSVIGMSVVPLPFTTLIVAPVKSNDSPYLYSVLLGFAFILMLVTLSFTDTS